MIRAHVEAARNTNSAAEERHRKCKILYEIKKWHLNDDIVRCHFRCEKMLILTENIFYIQRK